MSIFDAAAQLGTFPSGVLLGIFLAVISLLISLERRIPRPDVLIFFGDVLTVLFFAFCLFSLGVGMEGKVRYPTFFGSATGFVLLRSCAAVLSGKYKEQDNFQPSEEKK